MDIHGTAHCTVRAHFAEPRGRFLSPSNGFEDGGATTVRTRIKPVRQLVLQLETDEATAKNG